MMPNGTRSAREIRRALRIQPLHTRNTADNGMATTAAASSRVQRPISARTPPLIAMNIASPAIHRSPLSVLRTLNGRSSQACSNSRCTARVKLSTASTRKKTPSRPMLVVEPAAGAKIASTASAPPPVSW